MAEKETCIVCERLQKAVKEWDVSIRDFAQTVYILHLRDGHGLSELEILKTTGVYVH